MKRVAAETTDGMRWGERKAARRNKWPFYSAWRFDRSDVMEMRCDGVGGLLADASMLLLVHGR